MRRLLLLVTALLAGCVANVMGPTGRPLTAVEIRALATPVLAAPSGQRCGWMTGGEVTDSLGGIEERWACQSPAAPADLFVTYVRYARERGRWTFRTWNRLVVRRCRVDRNGRDDLGRLHCWAEGGY